MTTFTLTLRYAVTRLVFLALDMLLNLYKSLSLIKPLKFLTY